MTDPARAERPDVSPGGGAHRGSITGEHYRITPLTPRLVRLEWSPSGRFEERPSSFALHRDLPAPEVRVGRERGRLLVESEGYRLEYDEGPFSPSGLRVEVRGGVSNYHSVWRYGQDPSLPADHEARRRGRPERSIDGNLGGAARTLDLADGEVPLEPGVNSVNGFAVIDDSGSMVLEDGMLVARGAEEGAIDLYVFAAGHDHVAAVRDLFAISGPQPILPRWALGNWWSRYHRYTEESYLALMDRFADEGIPFSVAVIDMDWHLVDVDPRHGSGWTGYTWNRELFPDPARFQGALHERGLRVTLNDHPADGVRAFEEPYAAMCTALGREADGSPIVFDPTDPAFLRASMQVLHRSLEELGTDFWWVDWQSGRTSDVPGVDPLWVLNHAHFTDNEEQAAERGERGLTFSRYAGPGSHRYPVGFSGDSIISWESLAFQPRFTAAAANIGYGWWSHDIGGHMGGARDDELAMRWVQFGVLSPIVRLHSSNSPFGGKEPWRFSEPARTVMVEQLRLRHRLVPYLHAMNRRAHVEGRSLVEPVYFEDTSAEAYAHRGQYLFGSELLVAPIVRPMARDIARGSVDVWLPEGRWIDVFTGWAYRGGRSVRMHRDAHSVPTLLRAGGILPLVAEGEDLDARRNPEALEVIVAAGADGDFTLWEEPEGGAAKLEDWVGTRIALDAEAGVLRLELPARPVVGERRWGFRLLGFDAGAFGDVETVVVGHGAGAEAGGPVVGMADPGASGSSASGSGTAVPVAVRAGSGAPSSWTSTSARVQAPIPLPIPTSARPAPSRSARAGSPRPARTTWPARSRSC
ncbi:glycoside hydrolase family 31 protein [Brachybacterium huguangmaarense]